MSILRPNFGELFRAAVGKKVGGRPDVSASSVSESRLTRGPEDGVPAVVSRTSDPPLPGEGDLWIRRDRTPPELRIFSSGQTYAVPFAPVAAEPQVPRRPSASLRPRFYPRGFEPGTPRPRYPKRTLYPPFRPRGD